MDRSERPPWSDLPPEVLSMIGKRLDTGMDVLRFRSVCSSFRSSIPPPHRNAPRFPIRVPHSLISSVFLCESTICVLETPDEASDSGAPSPPRSRWLVKVQESNLGDVQLLSLFSQMRITCLPRNFPKVIDSLEFGIVEICREYRLEYSTWGVVPGIRKVVVSPDCVWTDLDELEVYSIVEEGRLGYWKYGDENWTYLDDQRGCSYDDIIVYEGKVCVVDWSGMVSLIDSSFRTQKLSPSICTIDGGSGSSGGSSGNCKYLVVSSGDLYVVDRYFSGNRSGYEFDAYMEDFLYPDIEETFDFTVYRLDRRCGKWVEVRSLGNMAFFLSNHCSYAISMHELGGCNGNCIYFLENTDSPSLRDKVNVFSLDDRSIKCLVFSDFLMSTRGTSDLTRPKSTPSRSKEFVD
ncbi:putative F-box protein At5g60060 [Rhodamnia argentea]|uniref:F-box protein At5g60060 n=1 Tax=Rhodamnia argentea TaxID=178133 RepID=A0A8B8PLY1_9MYRT|nr:putative F-box protein At5g60060 [Rhodamnia argentea]